MPLNKQIRGPNNTLSVKPSNPYSAGTVGRGVGRGAPSMNKGGTKGGNPPKETAAQERAEYDQPSLDKM